MKTKYVKSGVLYLPETLKFRIAPAILTSGRRPTGGGGGGGGGGSLTFLRAGTFNAASTTTASGTVDITSAALLVVSVSNYQLAGGGLDADPSGGGNTYIAITPAVTSPDEHIATNQLFYVINPIGGPTFTLTCTHSYTIINWACYSDASTPTFVSSSTHATAFTDGLTTQSPGSITPSGASHLLVTGVASANAFSGTPINSSFNSREAVQQGGNGLWGGIADKISSSAENPAWSFVGTCTGGAQMAEFAP